MLPTVERGVRVITFCSIAIAGHSPLISSTSGFTIRAMNWRAYALRLSAYRRWPSANRVSIVRDDFPDPETPVTTTSLLRGMPTLTFFRLCTRAPLIRIIFLSTGRSGRRVRFFVEMVIILGAKIPRQGEYYREIFSGSP